MTALPDELRSLHEAYDANERTARELVASLTEAHGTWHPAPGSWSVAECLDHLAFSNRVYIAAMQPPAAQARVAGRMRRRSALPGVLGGWFVKSLEPPVTRRMRAPRTIVPRPSPGLADAASTFFASHDQVVQFLRVYADIDLAATRFPNPFIRAIRFSLATGVHVLAAHERRHLWQASNVARLAGREGRGAGTTPIAAR
jgi:hypothetical protein